MQERYESLFFWFELLSPFLLLYFYAISNVRAYVFTIEIAFVLFWTYCIYYCFPIYVALTTHPMELPRTIRLIWKEPKYRDMWLISRTYLVFFLFSLKFYSSQCFYFWIVLTSTWTWEACYRFFVVGGASVSDWSFFSLIHLYFYYNFITSFRIKKLFNSNFIRSILQRVSSRAQVLVLTEIVEIAEMVKARAIESLSFSMVAFLIYHPIYVVNTINENSLISLWFLTG